MRAVRCGPGALVAGLVLIAGCAVGTKAVRHDQALDPTSAYVYGAFVVKATPSTMGEKGRPENQTVGLLIACGDGATYPLYFSSAREVRVVKIHPASCTLREIRYVNDLGIIRLIKPPPPNWIHLNYFAAGHAYYVGDYFAVASLQILGGYPARELLTWDMDPADDRFADTTAELRRGYTALAAMPVHDQRFAPRRHEARRGLAGKDEPLMSPARISRLATFVNHSFSSPAACKAGCPTGDCLPYRSAAGAAMTCIVHCMSTRDCAAGTACNCIHHPGVDCQPLAETPTDPMEGICLPAPAASLPAVRD